MKCIRPTYINDFKCDGKKCGSRCCKGWQVTVDNETYQKYCEIDEIMSQLEPADNDLHFVKMQDDFKCPFLDGDSLCKIQKQYGEEYLTKICHSYPRVNYRLGDVLEQSLTLTCPVAAKLILLPTEPMQFEVVEIDKPRAVFEWTDKLDLPLVEALDLQEFSISILQDRTLNLNMRLFKLCVLLCGEDNLKLQNDFDINKHAQMMIDIFCEMYNADMDERKKINLQSTYISYRDVILSRLMKDYNNIFENYIVNEFFMRCYPFAFAGGIWTNCKIFITSVKAMEFAIILTAISKNGVVSVDEFLMMIDAVNEKLDHNRGGMKAIIKLSDEIIDFKSFIDYMIYVSI